MIYRTPQEKIDEYYQKSALNQSSLKVIVEAGMQTYIKAQSQLIAQESADLYYEEKEHFVIGSAVDFYMTMGEQLYLKTYHFSSIPKPGETVMSIVKHTYDTVRGTNRMTKLADLQDVIYQSCNANSYYMNRKKPSEADEKKNSNAKVGDKLITWKDDNRWIDIVTKGEPYFKELVEAGDKQVLSEAQNQIINRITDNYTTHPYTAWLFKDAHDIDIIYQCAIYFTLEGVYCKALLDMVRINHNSKTITGLDIKTTGKPVFEFNRAVRKRRYDIQASFYTQALQCGIKTLEAIIGKSLDGYKFNNFAFIVESTENPVCPLIFRMSDELLLIGEHGRKINEMDSLLGWRQGITSFIKWSETGFSVDAITEETRGIIEVNNCFQYNKLY